MLRTNMGSGLPMWRGTVSIMKSIKFANSDRKRSICSQISKSKVWPATPNQVNPTAPKLLVLYLNYSDLLLVLF